MLAEKIEDILAGKLRKPKGIEFYEKYHGKFRESGVHKGKTALNQIKSLSSVPELKRLAYVSVGGSEGSEIEYILKNSDIQHGFLLEFDSYACQIANKRKEGLPDGETLQVIHGNVVEKLPMMQKLLHDLRAKGEIDGVFIVANAIFHELPYRGKGFGLNSFLKELFWDWDPCIFLSREPCKPFNWPEKVEISIDGISSDLLFRFSHVIKRRLSLDGDIVRSGPHFVTMGSHLATEAIHKLFYIDDFDYEIQECLTCLDPDEFMRNIEDVFGKNSVFQVRLNSSSFSRKYQEHNITVKTLNGTLLSMPLSFVSVVGSRIKKNLV